MGCNIKLKLYFAKFIWDFLVCVTISCQSWSRTNNSRFNRCFCSCEITQKVSISKYLISWKRFFSVNHRNEDTASSSTDPYTITGAGFQFLLMNRRSQVWFFIIHSLETRQVDFYSFVWNLFWIIIFSNAVKILVNI